MADEAPLASGRPRLVPDGLALLAAAMLLGEDATHRTILGGETGILEFEDLVFVFEAGRVSRRR